MRSLRTRLSKLEAKAPVVDFSVRLFGVIRGSLDEAQHLPARLGLVADFPYPVIVTKSGWDGGEPIVVSPLVNLDDVTDEGLRVLCDFRCDPSAMSS